MEIKEKIWLVPDKIYRTNFTNNTYMIIRHDKKEKEKENEQKRNGNYFKKFL